MRMLVAALAAAAIVSICLPASAATDSQLVDKVRRAIVHDKLEPRPECLEYRVTRNSDPGIDRVDVSARHDATCGGDPQLDEHLFSVYIDQKTHQMASDAADPVDGTLKVLPP